MPTTKTRLPPDASDSPPAAFEVGPLPLGPGRERIGTTVDDRYRIVDVIGIGGMGIVYRAEHQYIQRTVALKILDEKMAAMPQLFERFEREARAIGRLDHPNCVSVHDFGHLPDGSCYLTMPFLEGPTLADALIDGRLPVRRALRIARHIASALAHIHKAGIVHRDIKPENIVMIDREGDPDFATLLDFGIAKLVALEGDAELVDRGDLTMAGQRFGTPAYMSPEQAIGAPLDHRCDIYGLSVVLYELLTGTTPFRADDAIELMRMQERAPVPPFSVTAPDASIPEPVEELVRKGLAKNPGERFASAVEVIDALDACLSAPSPDEVRAPWYARRATVAGIAVVALIVAAVAYSLWPTEGTESHEATRARELLAQGKPAQAAAYLDGHPALAEHADAHLLLGHAYAASGRPGDAIAAYRRALSRDASYAKDTELVGNLYVAFEGDDPLVAAEAAGLLLSPIEADDVAGRVVTMASSHAEEPWRRLMRQVADNHGLSEQVDWLASYSLDLGQGRDCPARRDAIVQLRALGDARAIVSLEAALERSDNGCLKAAAADAIRVLRQAAPHD